MTSTSDNGQEQTIDFEFENLSKAFSDKVVGTFGPSGERWLQNLPRTLSEAAERWSLNLLPPFQPLSYNYVAPAVGHEGEPVVLKAGVPNRELVTEIHALRHFDGQGAVRLIDFDEEKGLMLLERLQPGVPLRNEQDDATATSVFAKIMRRLKKPPPEDHIFPSVSDWSEGFKRLRDNLDGKTGPFPEEVIDRAEKIMVDLLNTMSAPIVLHGDLHHWNILSADREPWLALDPKGVIGEPEYETGAWLRNPFPQILETPNPKRLIARRVDQLVEELGFDRHRVIGWAYSQAVLSAVWSFEEGSVDLSGWLAWSDKLHTLL